MSLLLNNGSVGEAFRTKRPMNYLITVGFKMKRCCGFTLSALCIWLVLSPSDASSSTIGSPRYVFATAGDSEANLEWQAVPGAVSYSIKQTRRLTVDPELIESGITELSYHHNGIRNLSRGWYYIVAAVDENGEEYDSVPARVTPSDGKFGLLPLGVGNFEDLGSGYDCAEGPVWNPADGGFLVFSDIIHDRQMKWSVQKGIEVFREPSNRTNGAILDQEGRLLFCERTTRQITRMEIDGSVSVVTADDNNQSRYRMAPSAHECSEMN